MTAFADGSISFRLYPHALPAVEQDVCSNREIEVVFVDTVSNSSTTLVRDLIERSSAGGRQPFALTQIVPPPFAAKCGATLLVVVHTDKGGPGSQFSSRTNIVKGPTSRNSREVGHP